VKIERFALGQWFATGNFDQPASKVPHAINHRIHGDVLASRKRIFAVAPGTAHRAAGQPHEGTRAASMSGFSLN